MRQILTAVSFIALCLPIAIGTANAQTQQNPVIIELFTSQGCSSCPAADRLLGKLVNEVTSEASPVYALSFHVNYWDYLGWKDPYSTEEFTNRQHYYASAFGESSVYTPQLVINGKQHLVGSNEAGIRQAIDKQLKSSRDFTISIARVTSGDGAISLDFRSTGNENHVVQVAIVEGERQNFVPRGENKGRELHHYRVVRGLHTYAHTTAGRVDIALPDSVDLSHASIIVFLQDKRSWEILAADQWAPEG